MGSVGYICVFSCAKSSELHVDAEFYSMLTKKNCTSNFKIMTLQ